MAYYSFTRDILAGKPIRLYDHGHMRRDFTYVDDIVTGILGAPTRPSSGLVPHRLYNFGNHRSEKLGDVIALLESRLNKKAIIEYCPMQPGDVLETFADIDDAMQDFGYAPVRDLAKGLSRFVDWYHEHYDISSSSRS